MDVYLPLGVPGSNLQEKHRHLNSSVNEVFKQNIAFQDVLHQPELSPVHRIFKIDLASKYKNIEYIIENLKNDDMLYVSRALQCFWILEPQYCGLINPAHLESTLYPAMIKPAVNKMKHFIQLNLKEVNRCEEFYKYYKESWEEAFHFFWHCSKDFITGEFPNIIDKLSYKQLKIVIEVCPSVSSVYFEILPINKTALQKYVNNAQKYFDCFKSVLKYDGNMFLDIVEKYFDTDSFKSFSPSATEYIMKNHRSRFDAKSELYAKSILHMKTLATHMTNEQAKELILKLARADYLDYWFSYVKVEPLIKRLNLDERSAFKKKVFVDKVIGEKIKDWPYSIPKGLVQKADEAQHIFTDVQHEPYEYEYHPMYPCAPQLMRKKCAMYMSSDICYADCEIARRSPLDQLFNRYRFIGFEQSFYELSKNLLAESTSEGRLNMMLVLVSKSGGVPDQVEKFMKLMVERHRNEPTTLRAAVVRSLVKRGAAWRLPEHVWSLILQFGGDVGLDGAHTEPHCSEGLHAVVLRHILADAEVSPALLSGFIRCFSTFSSYKLNVEEKKLVARRLPQLVLSSDANAFLDTLLEYKVDLKNVPNAEEILLKAARENSDLAARLYKAKILRRELFHETFPLKQNNAAYVNALRHDTTPLQNGKSFAELAKKERPNHDRFFKFLSVYFGEPGGLAEQHRTALEDAFTLSPKYWFARPLSCLLTDEELLQRIDGFESERPQSKSQRLMSTGLRASAHMSRPPVDIEALDWKWIGVKAVSNKALICRTNDRKRYVEKLLEWRRTARVAVRLSGNTPLSADTFLAFSTLRPLAALKIGFSLYLSKEHIQPTIWDAIKSIMQNKDLSEKTRLLKKLSDPESISKNVQADYWIQIFNIFAKIDVRRAMPMLCRCENLLRDVDKGFVRDVAKHFIDAGKLDSSNVTCLYSRVVAKHLLLCETEEEQKETIQNVCGPFFDALEVSLKIPEKKKDLTELLEDFIFALKYSDVFISDQYVSCMPVFEVVLERMRKLLPVEEYFAKYAELHLTMLYYKTIKQANKQKPGIFDDANTRSAAVELVGRIFGNYIGHEVKELVMKYFPSVIDLYKVSLQKYLRNYFHFEDGRAVLVASVVKALLAVGSTEAFILAENIYQKEHPHYITEPQREHILNVLKDCRDEEVKMFVYADVIAVPCE